LPLISHVGHRSATQSQLDLRSGYEPNGVIHDMTNFPEDTVLYFTNFGPIRYIDDDDNTTGLLDWQGVLKAAEEAESEDYIGGR
jgi:hypothetical protein